jgi:hypothetical protein
MCHFVHEVTSSAMHVKKLGALASITATGGALGKMLNNLMILSIRQSIFSNILPYLML